MYYWVSVDWLCVTGRCDVWTRVTVHLDLADVGQRQGVEVFAT